MVIRGTVRTRTKSCSSCSSCQNFVPFALSRRACARAQRVVVKSFFVILSSMTIPSFRSRDSVPLPGEAIRSVTHQVLAREAAALPRKLPEQEWRLVNLVNR
jgi:hypothetical protein